MYSFWERSSLQKMEFSYDYSTTRRKYGGLHLCRSGLGGWERCQRVGRLRMAGIFSQQVHLVRRRWAYRSYSNLRRWIKRFLAYYDHLQTLEVHTQRASATFRTRMGGKDSLDVRPLVLAWIINNTEIYKYLVAAGVNLCDLENALRVRRVNAHRMAKREKAHAHALYTGQKDERYEYPGVWLNTRIVDRGIYFF